MSDTMNGEATVPPVAMANPIVSYFQELAAAAERGEIVTAGCIIIGPQGQIGTSWVGGRMGDLHLGSCIMTKGVLDAITSPKRNTASRILRPLGS